MKKLPKILKIMLSFVLIVTLSFAIIPMSTAVKAEEKAERKVVLADYDTFDDVFNTFDVMSNLSFIGYYTQTTDESKVLSGSGSLEMFIEGTLAENWSGWAQDGGYPAFLYYVLANNTKNDGNFGFDWKYLSGLSVDIYNPNDFEIRVSMFMMTRDRYPYNHGYTVVPAGGKVTLNSHVSRYFMQNDIGMKKVTAVTFTIDYDRTVLDDGYMYFPEAYVYMDNLTATVNENPLTDENGATIINKQYAQKEEILNFDSSSDLQYMNSFGGDYVKEEDNLWATRDWWESYGSSIYYNTNEKYIHEGNVGSLEWRLNPTFQSQWTASNWTFLTDRSYLYPSTYTGITVCSDYLNAYNFASLKNGKAKITVDIYNAGSYAKEVAFGIHDLSGVGQEVKHDFPYSYGELASTDRWTRLEPNKWYTLELTDFSHLDLSQGLARLRLFTSFLDVAEPMSFYVNNLRITYGA